MLSQDWSRRFRVIEMISFRFLLFDTRWTRAITVWKTVATGLGTLTAALDALVFPWSCPVCGAEAFGKPFCGRVGRSFWTSLCGQVQWLVHDVHYRPGRLPICVAAAQCAEVSPWALTRHLRWVRMTEISGICACSSSMSVMLGLLGG